MFWVSSGFGESFGVFLPAANQLSYVLGIFRIGGILWGILEPCTAIATRQGTHRLYQMYERGFAESWEALDVREVVYWRYSSGFA